MIPSLRLLGLVLILLLRTDCSDSLMQLSDLSTPALVFDVDHYVKQSISSGNNRSSADQNRQNKGKSMLPTTITFPNSHSKLKLIKGTPHDEDSTKATSGSSWMISDPAIRFFWHASVVHSRNTDTDGSTKEPPLFLAKLDLPLSTRAHLVLGWNNHHVISYYWARSAGAGAAMEAPGISLTDKSELVWSSPEGPRGCQSNDGKRSEWVNFLRPGDQVQLLPDDGNENDSLERIVVHWCNHCREVAKTKTDDREDDVQYVYGISCQGRPLGSEPSVVGKWKLIPEKS